MIDRLVLLGATGDLAGRFVLPALAALLADGRAPDGLRVVGAAPDELDDDGFARHVAEHLDEHATGVPAAARERLVGGLTYARVDLEDAATLAAAVRAAGDGGDDERAPVAVYCALPPTAFGPALTALTEVALPPGSRVAVEKPFGSDRDDAVRLNALLRRISDAGAAVFRTDHALGLPGTADLLARRGPGGDLAGAWNGEGVAQVDVLWEETLALEGRADFYDRAGALRDVVQNHLVQVLLLVVADLPPSDDVTALHDAKLAALRSLHAPAGAAPGEWARRGRYTAGRLASGEEVPDYADEDGVDPARSTETWAELVLVSDAPRWAGTRFVLRTGKALGGDRKGVLVHLRPGAPSVPGEDADRRVWLDLDERTPSGERVPGEVPAYEAVLSEVLADVRGDAGGGSRLSVSAEESEEAWGVVEPALAAWAAGDVELREYPAGS